MGDPPCSADKLAICPPPNGKQPEGNHLHKSTTSAQNHVMQSRQESHEVFIKKTFMLADEMSLEKHDNIYIYIFFYIIRFHLWPRQYIPVICEFLPHSEHGILRLSSIQDNRELRKMKKADGIFFFFLQTVIQLIILRQELWPLSNADFPNWQITDMRI